LDFIGRLFSSDGFMPHGHCYLWRPGVLWLHLISDALVALAYTSIPFTLLYLVRKRKDTPFNWMMLCFGVFIIACGATHVMEIWTLWTPTYWLAGTIKAVTAAASVATAVLLIRLVPKALAIPTVRDLEIAHDELRIAHELLETRVQERTAELTRKNDQLAVEIAERKRVEEALRKSEVRFRRLSDSGTLGIITADLAGRVLDANETFLQMVGYSQRELVAGEISWVTLTPPVEQLKASGIAAARETEYVRRDGRRVPILVGVAMLDPSEDTVIAFALDRTESREAEAAIRGLRAQHEVDAKFRALLESAPMRW